MTEQCDLSLFIKGQQTKPAYIAFKDSYARAKELGYTHEQMLENLAVHESRVRYFVWWHFIRRHCYGGDYDRQRASEEIRRIRQDFPMWRRLLEEKATEQ